MICAGCPSQSLVPRVGGGSGKDCTFTGVITKAIYIAMSNVHVRATTLDSSMLASCLTCRPTRSGTGHSLSSSCMTWKEVQWSSRYEGRWCARDKV